MIGLVSMEGKGDGGLRRGSRKPTVLPDDSGKTHGGVSLLFASVEKSYIDFVEA